MFYVIYGEDTYRSREKMKEFLASFKGKNPQGEVFELDAENFNSEKCGELLRGRTLFEKQIFITAKGLLQNAEASDFIFKNLDKFYDSANIFIFLEEDIDEKHVEKLKKCAVKVQEFKSLTGAPLRKWFSDKNISASAQEEIITRCGSDLWCAMKEIGRGEAERGVGNRDELFGEQKEKIAFNVFGLCDAVAARDRKKAWLMFNEATLAGVEAEEVFYKILWQIKNLLLVKILSKTKGLDLAKETGFHPYVLQKTLSAVGKFSEDELSNFSFTLVKLFHDSRWGINDLTIGVEKFLIGI